MNLAEFLQKFGGSKPMPQLSARYGLGSTGMDYGQMPTQDTTGRNSSGYPSDQANTKPTPPVNMAAG